MRGATRLFLCRLSLVVLAVLPTVVVFAWILVGMAGEFWLAGKSEWERALTERLGLVAQIDQVRYSRPGVAELVGVRLLDSESQAVVVETGRVEIAVKADGWQVAAEQPVIFGDRLGCLARVVAPRILESRYSATVWMTPCDVLLRSNAQEQSLQNLEGQVRFSASKTEFELSWQLPDAASASDSIRLVATRDRASGELVTRYRLDTGKNVVPCRLAATLVPELANLGRECQFRGAVEFYDTAGEFSGQLSGTLTQVDLDSLVTERFGHRLSGLATVRIERGSIGQGKLTELRGTIQASDGVISRSLVLAAAEHLGLNAANETTGGSPDEHIAFGRLAIEFQMSGAALRLRGTADAKHEGVLLTTASGPILKSPAKHSVAAVALLRTLLPDTEYQVPATRQTAALVRLLPVPDATLSRPAEGPLHTPTRLMPAAQQPAQAAIRQPVLR